MEMCRLTRLHSSLISHLEGNNRINKLFSATLQLKWVLKRLISKKIAEKVSRDIFSVSLSQINN